MAQAAISVDALVLADTFRWNQVLSKVSKKTKQTKGTPSVLYFLSLTLNDLVNQNYHTVDCCQQMVLTLAETLSDQVSPLAVSSWDFVAQIVLLLPIKLTLQIGHGGMFTWAAVGVFIGMSLLGVSHRRTVSAGCTNTHADTNCLSAVSSFGVVGSNMNMNWSLLHLLSCLSHGLDLHCPIRLRCF